MTQSDALSRREDHIPDKDTNNEDMVMLPKKLFVQVIDTKLKKDIQDAILKDSIVEDTIHSLKMGVPLPLQSAVSDWKIKDGITYSKDKCYVPQDLELQWKIVQRAHNHQTAGHPEIWKTKELVNQDYWWPGMGTFIWNYIEGCIVCQQMKVVTHKTKAPLMPIKDITKRPWGTVTCDFITDLPESHGYNSIMVMCDHSLMKGVIFHSCNKTMDASGMAEILLDTVYRRFRLLEVFISDRGPQFTSQVFRELGKILEIDMRMSTTYHPQTDGQLEQTNQKLERYL